jgi:hypothetical protein
MEPKQAALVEKAKRELRGKVLGCWCKPLDCHGDVLKAVADETAEETEMRRGRDVEEEPVVLEAFLSSTYCTNISLLGYSSIC